MVEFALVLPIFVLLLCGMLDFGFALFSRMTVINAAREGARAVVTVDTTSDAALADVPNAAAGAVASAAGSLAVTTSVSCVSIETSGACRFVASDPGTNAQVGDAVKVNVAYTYHTFFPFFFGAQFDLGSSVQMVIE